MLVDLLYIYETTIEQTLRYVSEQIVSDIDKVKGIDIYALHPDDISFVKTKDIMPASLKQLLRLFYNGGNEHKILSIAQDIINLNPHARK